MLNEIKKILTTCGGMSSRTLDHLAKMSMEGESKKAHKAFILFNEREVREDLLNEGLLKSFTGETHVEMGMLLTDYRVKLIHPTPFSEFLRYFRGDERVREMWLCRRNNAGVFFRDTYFGRSEFVPPDDSWWGLEELYQLCKVAEACRIGCISQEEFTRALFESKEKCQLTEKDFEELMRAFVRTPLYPPPIS